MNRSEIADYCLEKLKEKGIKKANCNVSFSEKKESENQNNNLEISLINSEVFPIENDLLKQKLEKDLYLRESLKLFSDFAKLPLIQLSLGNILLV